MCAVHLRNVDLNLLLPLHALLEERNVTRAGKRVNLSQSAMSRALERLRETLADDLLIRAQRGYQLTPRGNVLLQELELLLPRLEQLWSGETFSPGLTNGRMRLAMTDYAAAVILPCLLPELGRVSPGLTIEVLSWHERSYDDLTIGAVDLVFSPLATPSTFRVEQLFDDKFVCLLGQEHSCKRRSLPLREYLSYGHISVETQPKQQNLIDRSLAEAGLRRKILLHLPYIIPAVLALENTALVLTIPSRLAKEVIGRYRIRQVAAPSEVQTFQYSMVWHPRLEREALHCWFREVVRQVCSKNVDRRPIKIKKLTGSP